MSIHILNKQNAEKNEAEATIHSMPCKIHADGPALVQKYFEPYIQTNENGGKFIKTF